MNNPFYKSFEAILEEALTDWRNQDPAVDLSQGSPNTHKTVAQSSAVWGLHKSLAWVADQIFPDSADYDQLVTHAAKLGLSLAGSPAELLARVLAHLRHPPAGGNKYDYVRWAKEASTLVAAAWCVSMGQGPGTVDLVVLADADQTGSEIPTAELLALVRAYIVDICPDDVKFLRVLAPEVLYQNVSVSRTEATEPAATAIANITNYLAGFLPGQSLFRAQLTSLALGGGSGDAEVVVPAGPVVPTQYQMIRPGVIDVA